MVSERESGGGGDSDSEHQLDVKFIIVQTVQTVQTDDGPEEIRPYSGCRFLNTTGYYMLDLQTGDVSILPPTVQVQERHNFGSMSSMVALGSKLYIFGTPISNSDDEEPSSSYFLDLPYESQSTKPLCWKRAHPLTTDDELPSGVFVAFAGKMYLFRDTDSSSFCEVFDPSEQPEPKWRGIKSTPTPTPGAIRNKIDPTIGTGVAPTVLTDHKNNRIIVFLGNLSSLYAYYPFEDRWECLVECFFLEGVRGWFFYPEAVTIVDGVIYVHRRKLSCFFMAFDIATQQWLKVSVSSDAVHPYKVYLPIRFYRSLLHLGKDVFCLLGSRYKDASHTPTLVHVVQFKVKLINNYNNGTKEVIVTPLPSRSRHYELHSDCALYHSLAL